MREKINKKTVGYTETDKYLCLEDLENAGQVSVLNPINLDYYGSEKCEPCYQFGPNVRTCYVIHFVIAGKGVLMKNGKKYPVKAGEAFLLYPNEETTYRADKKDPWSYMWLGFHGIQAGEMMEKAGFRNEQPVLKIDDMDHITSIMNKLLEYKMLTYVNNLRRMSCLYEIMAELAIDDEESGEGATYERGYVKAAVEIMTASYPKSVKVAELANMIGINRSYLTTLFKQEMQMSPQEFWTKFRMEKATSLLDDTDSSISAVAMACGYNDGLTFSKAFKRYFNVSPAEYRREKTKLDVQNTKGRYDANYPL